MANSDEGQRRLQDLFANLRAGNTAVPAPASLLAENTHWQPQSSTAPSADAISRFSNAFPSQQQSHLPATSAMPQSHSAASAANNHAYAHQPRAQGDTPQTVSQSSHGGPVSSMDQTSSLLNLLRHGGDKPQGSTASPFNSTPAAVAPTPSALNLSGFRQTPSPASHVHNRGISASDLVASFMGKPSAPETPRDDVSPLQEPAAQPSSANPQDFLLQLLNQSQSSFHRQTPGTGQADADSTSKNFRENRSVRQGSEGSGAVVAPAKGSGKSDTPMRVFGSNSSREPTPFEPKDLPTISAAPGAKEKSSNVSAGVSPTAFDEINPFEPVPSSFGKKTPSGRSSRQSHQLSRLGEGSRRVSKQDSGTSLEAPKEELTASGGEILQSIESPAPQGPGDGRSNIEALMGIGAPTEDPETVTQALNDVGAKAIRQLENVSGQENAKLSNSDDRQVVNTQAHEAQQLLREAAAQVNEEVDAMGGEKVLEEELPRPIARDVKRILEEAAVGNVEGHQGSADDADSSENGDDDFVVPVYNFPLRPFVSIDLKQDSLPTLGFRQDVHTEIARMKKEFDQIDRTLATASNDYIVYAMPKPGGYRIIRQDDGDDRQIFKETHDHIFNVAISNAGRNRPFQDIESCIGTAESGTVYWTALRLYGEDCVSAANIAKHCLSFPPVPDWEEHTSSGRLKTRAKRSNRHPELFAIGRGKSIQIVFPLHAQCSEHVKPNGSIDTEKYFNARKLRINTGKAGKDFCFSEDDTVVATLDKAGRFRMWDARDLIEEANNNPVPLRAVEVNQPLITFSTVMPNEKLWPTSVLFIDKTRAYSRGSAQRYVIIGMKQNHTLQLWDLGLGKPVQELNFPHESEGDAICSVVYHPPTGIVAVGHPTRNSIYFIHLSAPKYNVQAYSQAKYVQKLATKDPAFPEPDSTAILSGMREYSFASKGQLRSVDLLPVTAETTSTKDDPGLFELYVMHSKGVTCLNLHKIDLGWGEDSKVLDSRSAEDSGLITVKDLSPTLPPAISEHSSVNGDVLPTPTKGPLRVNAKRATETNNIKSEPIDARPTSLLNGSPNPARADKRRKKRTAMASEDVPSFIPPPAPAPPTSRGLASPRSETLQPTFKEVKQSSSKNMSDPFTNMPEPQPVKAPSAESAISLGISPEFLENEVKKIEASVSAEFSKALQHELEALYQKLNEDKRVNDASHAAKHDAILRMVSAALNENTDKALTRIIMTNITQSVVPSIHNVTATTLRKEIPDWLSKHLLSTLPAQIRLAMPEAVSKAMQTQDVMRFMSDQITHKVAAAIEKPLLSKLQSDVLPQFSRLTIDSAQKKILEAEQRMSEKAQQASLQHREDNGKIERLTGMVRELTETVHALVEQNRGFQADLAALTKSHTRGTHDTESSGEEAGGVPRERVTTEFSTEVSPEQEQINRMAEMLAHGQFDQVMVEVC